MSGKVMLEHQTTPTNAHQAINAYAEGYGTFVNEHPILPVVQAGDPRVFKMSDFLSTPAFHDLGLYQEFFGRLSIEYQMGFALAVDRSRVAALAVNRGTRDFTERERLLLGLARPHIVQAYQNAVAFTALERKVTCGPAELDQDTEAMIVLTRDARVLSMSRDAELLLERYFDTRGDTNRLPEVLERWIARQQVPSVDAQGPEPLVMERQNRQLIARMAFDESRLVVLLRERIKTLRPEALRALGLTPREAEVLVRVAEGKSNPEIAFILDCSVRTVKKHLERIFCKLGVESRTAAALRVWQTASSTTFHPRSPRDR